MLVARGPGRFADMHFPPHADVFARFQPRHITEFVGLVEVHDQVGIDQAGGALGHRNGAPRRDKCPRGLDLAAVRPRNQIGLEPVATDVLQGHLGVIDQRRLVHAQVQPVRGFHGQRRDRLPDRRQRRMAIQVLVAIGQVGTVPPRAVIAGESELGQLVADRALGVSGIGRHLIAKPETVIVDPQYQRQGCRVGAGESDAQLAEVIAYPLLFAPRLLPAFIDPTAGTAGHAQAVGQRRRIGKLQAKTRPVEHRHPEPAEPIVRLAIAYLHLHLHDVAG